MLFAEALELLKAGEHVVREGWTLEEGYLTFLEGMNHVWKIITHPGPNAGNHIFSVNELGADDWMKLSDRQALLKAREEALNAPQCSPDAKVEL